MRSQSNSCWVLVDGELIELRTIIKLKASTIIKLKPKELVDGELIKLRTIIESKPTEVESKAVSSTGTLQHNRPRCNDPFLITNGFFTSDVVSSSQAILDT